MNKQLERTIGTIVVGVILPLIVITLPVWIWFAVGYMWVKDYQENEHIRSVSLKERKKREK